MVEFLLNKVTFILWLQGPSERPFIGPVINIGVSAFWFIVICLGTRSCRSYNILANSLKSWTEEETLSGKKEALLFHRKGENSN